MIPAPLPTETLTRSAQAPIGVRTVHELGDLSTILSPDVPAVVLDRGRDVAMGAWLDSLDPDLLPRTRVILRPAMVRDAVTTVCDTYGTPPCAERTAFIGEVSELAAAFSDLFGTPFLRMRLDVVTHNACRKFHIDAVKARLICTYRGAGTQYGTSVGGDDPTDIAIAPTGAPMLLRGTLWPKTPRSGLLHRSPPIEGTGETRLLLVLDPVFDPEDEDED